MPRPTPQVTIKFGATTYDITNEVNNIAIRRGRNRTSNKFEPGTAEIVIYDENGNWNPANTSSPYYGYLTPMAPITVRVNKSPNTYVIYTGYVAEYLTQFATGIEDVNKVTLRCVDAFRLLATSTTAPAGYASAGQYTGDRINAVLTSIGWSLSLRSIDTGNTTLQADMRGSTVALDVIQGIENSEAGGFFVSKDGKMTFLSRHNVIRRLSDQAPGRFRFSDVGFGYRFNQATIANDDTTLLNQVSITREGGTTQTVSDATSISTYFLRSGVRNGILVQTDAEALEMARLILATRKDPEVRTNSLTVNCYIDPDTVGAADVALEYELLQGIEVEKAMPGNTSITNTLLVDALHYDISRDSMMATLYMTEPLLRGLVLDDNYAGQLDYNVLAY